MKILISTSPFTALTRSNQYSHIVSDCEILYNDLNRRFTSAELAERIRGVDILIAGTETINNAVFDVADQLKLVARVGIGVDNIDLFAARSRGILIVNTPDGPTKGVIDLTLGLFISLLRGINFSSERLHGGLWSRMTGLRLSDAKVGIVGMGRIGSGLSKILLDLQCKNISYYDPHVNAEQLHGHVRKVASLTELLAWSDIVSLHLPLNETTRNLIQIEQLKIMKRTAFLVNTARGGIVDPEALRAALDRGLIAGAATDVYEEEPYSGGLCGCKNLIMTPHLGSMTPDCRTLMEEGALCEVSRFLSGLSPLSPVN